MAYGTRAAFEPIREVAFGSITSSYANLGTPFTDHVREIRIVNTCNTDMYLSTNASDNMIRMAAGSFYIIDFAANKVRDDGLFLPIGTQLSIKYQSAPATGSLWVETVYAQGGV